MLLPRPNVLKAECKIIIIIGISFFQKPKQKKKINLNENAQQMEGRNVVVRNFCPLPFKMINGYRAVF